MRMMEIEIFQQLLAALDQPSALESDYRDFGPALEAMLDTEVELLLEQIEARISGVAQDSKQDFETVLKFILGSLAGRARGAIYTEEPYSGDLTTLIDRLQSIYTQLDEHAEARHYVLSWLAALGTTESIERFTELIVQHPPKHAQGIVVAFQPLFGPRASIAAQAFPKLLEGIQYVELGAAILDLANYLTREGFVKSHPATDRRAAIGGMLQALTYHLNRIELGQLPPQSSVADISEKLEQSVALVISLCDSLALIGDETAIPKLQEAMELKHRRIRTEAAAALCRLGDESCRTKLLELLNEPVSRLRVIKYAEELGFADEIGDEFLTDEKNAESQLALWLAQPSQMGFAPTEVNVVDRRVLHWPGYDDLIDCFLIEFQFSSAAGSFTNVGIVGPVTFVFAADLSKLSRFDQYAAFAGWHASHDDLLEIPYDRACVAFRRPCEIRLGEIENQGYQSIEPLFLGVFFEQHILVANATKSGNAGQVIADGEQITWFDQCSEEAPICGELAYCIYKGRRFLQHFNPQIDDNLELID